MFCCHLGTHMAFLETVTLNCTLDCSWELQVQGDPLLWLDLLAAGSPVAESTFRQQPQLFPSPLQHHSGTAPDSGAVLPKWLGGSLPEKELCELVLEEDRLQVMFLSHYLPSSALCVTLRCLRQSGGSCWQTAVLRSRALGCCLGGGKPVLPLGG